MRKIWGALIVIGLIASITGCNKDLYDKELTKKALEITFHNDSVDKTHTWSLLDDYTVTVTANVTDVYRIEVLSVNPYAANNKTVELLATEYVEEGDEETLVYSVPKADDSVYVAAINTDGEYKVVAIEKGKETVDFTTLNTTNSGTLTEPSSQEVFYCYCNTFPQPSTTWSYNDLVLSIAKEVVSDKVLRIYVTLNALGNTTQTAGAVRLDGVSYDDVDSIKIVSTGTFNRYKDISRTIIKDEDTMLKGLDGSVIINLFDDAHRAFFVRTSDNGAVSRYMINVSHTTDKTHMEFSPITVTYEVSFKKSDVAQSIGYGNLDPFILYYYNSNIWEVHKYKYKFKESLYSYYSGSPESYDTGFSWSLEIPYKWFRYPLQGTAMGSYKNGAIYGAYQTRNHSFGEWGTNKNVATDWYLYPTVSVY